MDNFNIDRDTKTLKELVEPFDSSVFLAEIVELLKYDGNGRIPFRPFVSLDSPLRQLSYLASLNLSSDKSKITTSSPPSMDEWNKIMEFSVRVKAGYYDALLPKPEDDSDEFQDQYQTAMPVFFDYHDTGVINYEEQEIERIVKLFTPFDDVVEQIFGLKTSDFINIYEEIDDQIDAILNEPLMLMRNSQDVKDFMAEMRSKELYPTDWDYQGPNGDVKRFVDLLTNRLTRNTLRLAKSAKSKAFLRIFSLDRNATNFQYYTEPNPVLLRPIYRLDDERFLLLAHKQLIHAIYKTLYSELVASAKSGKILRA